MSTDDHEAQNEVHEQHVVSRVVLARWAVDGQLCAFNLSTGTVRKRSPRSEGWVLDFIAVESRAAEERWKGVEDDARAALDAVEDGSLFNDDAQVETIRGLLALHIARSKGFLAIFRRSLSRVPDGEHFRNLMALLRRPEVLDELFEHQTGGLVPAGTEGRRLAAERLLSDFFERLGGAQAFRDAVMEHYEQAQEWLRDKAIRIWRAESGEFLIGDMPVLTQDSSNQSAGVLDVPLGVAGSITMPLGPRHTLALSTAKPPGYEELPPNGVRNMNLLQVGTAPHKVYFRPGSGLQDVAEHEWRTYR